MSHFIITIAVALASLFGGPAVVVAEHPIPASGTISPSSFADICGSCGKPIGEGGHCGCS